jgi:hypothetical protein
VTHSLSRTVANKTDRERTKTTVIQSTWRQRLRSLVRSNASLLRSWPWRLGVSIKLLRVPFQLRESGTPVLNITRVYLEKPKPIKKQPIYSLSTRWRSIRGCRGFARLSLAVGPERCAEVLSARSYSLSDQSAFRAGSFAPRSKKSRQARQAQVFRQPAWADYRAFEIASWPGEQSFSRVKSEPWARTSHRMSSI